jgi:hypothetical protein
MATCKKCIHSQKCFNNSKTRYYGETIACNNVETLCEWFISTDDVVGVRRGRWFPQSLWEGDIVECSECQTIGSPQWNFCPVCGADMRGEKDE